MTKTNNGVSRFRTFITTKNNDLETHFTGFREMKAISYIASLRWLLEFLENNKFENIEILIGKEASDLDPAEVLKDEIAKDKENLMDRLIRFMDEGKLRIYTSERIIHSKFYILSEESSLRVIQGSANLTTSARKGRQINYLWEWNIRLDVDFDLGKKLFSDYESHKKYCTLFMQDIRELLKDANEFERQQIIDDWLGRNIESQEVEMMPMITQMVSDIISEYETEPIYRMTLPSEPSKRKSIEKLLEPIKFEKEQNQVIFLKKDFLNNEKLPVPIMRVDYENRKIIFNIKSQKFIIGDTPHSKEEIDEYLANLEEYIDSIDMGQTRNKTISNMTKMSMFEGLIYFLSAPFQNHYMKVKREKVGRVDDRGPKFLFISGGSSNGKTTFIKYALKLLTNKDINPIDKSKFKKQSVLMAAGLGTNFPLVFDDVPATRLNSADMESTIKSYWETWWDGNSIFPSIIVSSNAKSTKEWQQTRVKVLNFDVHFEPTMEAREKLNKIFNKENKIFSAFASVYFEEFDEHITDDELEFGRRTMMRLYEYSRRQIPGYFPTRPIEAVYDPDKIKWRELIELGKVTITEKKDSLEIKFTEEFSHPDIVHYANSVKHTKLRTVGNTIIIESPEDFWIWLDIEKRKKIGLFGKLFKKGK